MDLLKALAITGVILIHVSAGGYSHPVGSFDWLSALFWGSVSRASVPIFLMVTGALMLDPRRELTLRQLWLQKIPRLLASLLAWALIYQLWQMGRYDGGITPQELAEAVKQVLAFQHQNHLYYLLMALLVYALLPVTRIITAHADRHTLEYLLILWAVLGILYPTFKGCWPLTLLRGIPTQYGLNLTYTSAGYGLLGWYLRQYAASPRRWALTGAAGFLVIFGGTVVLSLKDGSLNETLLEAASPGTALLAAGICGWTFSAPGVRRTMPALHTLSRASFCVYLIHLIPWWELGRLGLSAAAGPCIILIPLTAAAVLACSLAVWAVLSRIPILGKWLT